MENVDKDVIVAKIAERDEIIKKLFELAGDTIENLYEFQSENADEYNDMLVKLYDQNERVKNDNS